MRRCPQSSPFSTAHVEVQTLALIGICYMGGAYMLCMRCTKALRQKSTCPSSFDAIVRHGHCRVKCWHYFPLPKDEDFQKSSFMDKPFSL